MKKTASAFVVAIMSLSPALHAADKSCAQLAHATPAFFYCDQINVVQQKTGQERADAAAELLTDVAGKPQKLAAALDYSMLDTIFQRAQDARVDKQTQAPASANGTTSLVSLPGATDLISVAVASGALTQTTSGTTTTYGANIGQTIAEFSKTPTFDYSLKGIPVLQNVDATISMSTNPSTTSAPVTASSNGSATSALTAALNSSSLSITGATARYQFYNRFDPKSSKFKSDFQQALSQNAQANSAATDLVGKTGNALANDFKAVYEDTATLDATRIKIANATTLQSVIDIFNSFFSKVRSQVLSNPKFNSDLAAAVSAMNAQLSLYRQIVSQAKGVPAITAEYTYTNAANQPETHNGRVIVGFGSTGGKMLSLNAAATFYGTLPQGTQVSRFRDFQASAQADIPIAAAATNNAIDFSVAGYGQYQQSASLLSVSASDLPSGFPANAPSFVAGTQGWLGVFQAKLTIHGPNGVQVVPVSWKWSNQTNLFSQPDNSFQFGLSYDISSLSQLFGSSQ